MDEKTFRDKLSEVADWKIPELKDYEVKEAKAKARGKGRRTNEEKYQEEHEAIFAEIFNGVNPTHHIQLLGVKNQSIVCPDCGILCPKGRVQEIRFHINNPGYINHKRIRCKQCKNYCHPETGQFDLPQGPAAQVFLNWAKSQYTLRNKLAKKQTDK
jgi:Pyruvate/2-oxoacid:ferredoxin oxidoreductase delta subunit